LQQKEQKLSSNAHTLNAAELIAFLRVRDGEQCQSVDMSFTGRIEM